MKFRNEKYEAVKIKWDGIDLPLRAGTPIDIGGNIANNANAIGIVMQTVTVRPVVDTLYIMMSGDVDLKELEKEAGITLSDEAKTAMSGINFWMDNARIYQPAPSEGGGGGSNEPFIMTFTQETTESETTITLDCSFNDVKNALFAGKTMYILMHGEEYDSYSSGWIVNLEDYGESGFNLELDIAGVTLTVSGDDKDALLSVTYP